VQQGKVDSFLPLSSLIPASHVPCRSLETPSLDDEKSGAPHLASYTHWPANPALPCFPCTAIKSPRSPGPINGDSTPAPREGGEKKKKKRGSE